MDPLTVKAIKQIMKDIRELGINPNEAKKEIFLGMNLMLGRLYEAYHGGEPMNVAGAKKIHAWANSLFVRTVTLN